MAALDPSLVQALAATAWDAADGAEQADLTTEATNDTTGAGINVAGASKVGKGGSPHGDILRVAFDQDFGGVAVNDTITVEIESIHNVDDLAILAYTAATTVTTTAKIVVTMATGPLVFTLTQAFIDELVELGTDGWAVRVVEDLSTGGDWQLSEVDADITAGGGDVTLTATSAPLNFTGGTAGLLVTLAAVGGALTLTGGTADLLASQSVIADGGALQFTGGAATPTLVLPATGGALEFGDSEQSDDFNRASIGSDWINGPDVFGALEIVANRIQADTTNTVSLMHRVETFSNDQFAELEVNDWVSRGANLVQPGVVVRVSGTITGYRLTLRQDASNYLIRLVRFADLVNTGIGSDVILGAGIPPDGTVVRLEIEGTTLRCYVDGVLQKTETDSTYASGSPGVLVFTFTATNDVSGDNWKGGRLPTRFTVTQLATGGALLLTGGTADLATGADVTLDAQPGTLTLAGGVASLDIDMPATGGALVLTGGTASPTLAMPAAGGALNLAGGVADLPATLSVVADGAPLLFTGGTAGLVVTLNAQPGSLTLAGGTAVFGRAITADGGSLLLTGGVAGVGGAALNAQPGTLTLAGGVASLDIDMPAAGGSLTLAGGTADLTVAVRLDAQPGTLILAGGTADLIATGQLVARRGGRFIFDREPEKQDQLDELIELVEPEITQAAPAARRATIRRRPRVNIPIGKRSRVDTLLAQTGITIEELIIIILM